jgi:hypothetical protein
MIAIRNWSVAKPNRELTRNILVIDRMIPTHLLHLLHRILYTLPIHCLSFVLHKSSSLDPQIQSTIQFIFAGSTPSLSWYHIMCLSAGKSTCKADTAVGQLGKSPYFPQDRAQDQMDSPASLADDFINFGFMDSLTLAKQRIGPSEPNTYDSVGSELEAEDSTLEEEDEIDAAWREFDSSWQDLMKANPISSVHSGSTARRSGVRRGLLESAGKTKTMKVLTKSYDGPSPDKGGQVAAVTSSSHHHITPPAA